MGVQCTEWIGERSGRETEAYPKVSVERRRTSVPHKARRRRTNVLHKAF